MDTLCERVRRVLGKETLRVLTHHRVVFTEDDGSTLHSDRLFYHDNDRRSQLILREPIFFMSSDD